MDDNQRFLYYAAAQSEEEMIDVMRKGPWTMEEDLKLTNCIAIHGPGQWSYLARSAGLNRTGKSCRLRWLNYLHPDVKRGNLTLEEQLVILELHSRWGNRWSKIAEHLPGRTDNEVKNYWRTRVQKLAKQLKCDVNSSQFRDTMRHLWLPTLVERVRAESSIAQPTTSSTTTPSRRVLQTGIALAVSKSKSEISTASSSETPPEVQVSPASDLTYHDDFPGSNWYFQQEGPITGLSTACSISYCEQEEGFESQILEENNNGWLGGGCGDSLDYLLSKDYSWLIHDQASYHD